MVGRRVELGGGRVAELEAPDERVVIGTVNVTDCSVAAPTAG